jgi:hypothetical protein
MPRYLGATWRPVDRYKAGQRLAVPMASYDAVVGHTAVTSSTPSMHSFFNVAGRATPHLFFGQHGECEQYIDTDFRSSAVLNGNHRCLTWEAWDGFPWPNGVCPPYTDEQAEAMAQFCAWAHEVHGIELVQMPNSRPNSTGIGWHRLGVDGNFPPGLLSGRVAGGETWSKATGKTCPTDLRIRQFPGFIIPRAIDIATGVDMDWKDDLPRWKPGDTDKTDTMQAGRQISQARGFAASSYKLLLKLSDVDKFADAVAKRVAKKSALTPGEIKEAVKEALREEEEDV